MLMPKIFISYRRKSWGFTHRLADQLRERLDADIFVDVDSIDQTDFESAIVNHLRKSDVVLLVISETTFADRIHRDDDWVRREIRETLGRKIPLALICVEGLLPPSGLPEDIKDVARMQGISFYPEYFTPGVEKLTDFVAKVSTIRRRTAPLIAPQVDPVPAERAISGKATLDEALALMEKDDYDKAVFLLESLRETGYTSRFVKLDEILETARQHAQEAERRRTAQIEYDDIVPVVKSRVTRPQGLVAFQQWRAEYPDLVEALDTQKLRELVNPIPIKPTASTTPKRLTTSLDLMPQPFAWIDIPAGKVTLKTEKGWAKNYIPEGKSQTFDVPAFAIAKYPTTNAQFAKFIEAGGYNQQKWWTEAGWQTKEEQKWTEPRYWQDSQRNQPDHPVVGVSWYEAIAFCLWLSEATGEKVMLPTEQQWQRAAQGDDNRSYPWGKDWDGARCNNSVKPNSSQSTTPVTQYEGKGDSPFKVVDMSGNIWEWCLTVYESGSIDMNRTDERVLRGGSWLNVESDGFRAVYRYWLVPVYGDSDRGFRPARS
jgi:formylglycine-generating enzyme required for sulfatase activity